jgi:hypothetical protein
MQLRIAKLLNKLLAVVGLIIIAGGGLMLYLARLYPDLRVLFIGSFVLFSIALMTVYRWFESRWDKKVITRMAKEGKIALANITGARRVMPMRDTGFTSYWLYEFKSELYDNDCYKTDKVFYEKMNRETDNVPLGSVYVTYDEAKPGQVFIIPNVMISHLPHLAPIVKRYEEDKSIRIKYLDAYYSKGIVLKSFKETVPEHMKRKSGG